MIGSGGWCEVVRGGGRSQEMRGGWGKVGVGWGSGTTRKLHVLLTSPVVSFTQTQLYA